MQNQGELAPLKSVVEKELLHHDILREMSEAGLLDGLTFIGGTCLRACFGSQRLSEDLDFTGGHNFKRATLKNLNYTIINRLYKKYGLHITISEPVKETGNVGTWKIKITTRPEQKNMPLQRINIDICAVPSYDARPVLLRNHYNIDMGTSGLIIQAQSRQEILADKFIELLTDRQESLKSSSDAKANFTWEMRRFLPSQIISSTIEKDQFWSYLTDLVQTEGRGQSYVYYGE